MSNVVQLKTRSEKKAAVGVPSDQRLRDLFAALKAAAVRQDEADHVNDGLHEKFQAVCPSDRKSWPRSPAEARREAELRLEYGLVEASAVADGCYNDKMAIYDALIAVPPQTVSGLLIKIEATYFVDLTDEQAFVDHIREDVRQLAKQS